MGGDGPAVGWCVPSLALAWVVALRAFPATWPTPGRIFCASSCAAVAGLCAYGALAAAIGTLFSRHPLVAVLVYLMLVEEGLARRRSCSNLLAIGWHLRNIAELPLPATTFMAVTVPWWGSALFALAVTPGLVALTTIGVDAPSTGPIADPMVSIVARDGALEERRLDVSAGDDDDRLLVVGNAAVRAAARPTAADGSTTSPSAR